jgi:hypothetical protein
MDKATEPRTMTYKTLSPKGAPLIVGSVDPGTETGVYVLIGTSGGVALVLSHGEARDLAHELLLLSEPDSPFYDV